MARFRKPFMDDNRLQPMFLSREDLVLLIDLLFERLYDFDQVIGIGDGLGNEFGEVFGIGGVIFF
jgi:hypothetical protein